MANLPQQMAERLQRLQAEADMDVKEIQKIEGETRKLAKSKNTLSEQLNENELVLKELKLVEDGGNVFKLVGPILAKQDLNESKSNVEVRCDFVRKELARIGTLETAFGNKVEEKRAGISAKQNEGNKLVAELQREIQKQQQ
jgi:prefoldin beta subunit